MKAIILCTFLFVATWAKPQDQIFPPFKRVYVDPTVHIPPNGVSSRIINGEEAVPHSIPFQAYFAISTYTSDRWICGGSLISPRHILTAAHCLVDGVLATIYLGAHNLKESEGSRIMLESRNLIYHTDFNDTLILNDIGVIVLDEPVELNESINVVALPTRDVTTNYAGQNARVSGWGLESGDAWYQFSVLRQVNSTVYNNLQCGLIFYGIPDSQVCLSGEGGGACNGDSGGPLVVNNTLIGIVSYAVQGCPEGYPTAFTRVTSYLDWIEENTGISI